MYSNILVVEANQRLREKLRDFLENTPLVQELDINQFYDCHYFDRIVLININTSWLFSQNQKKLLDFISRFKECIFFYSKTDMNSSLQNYINLSIEKNINIIGCFEIESINKNHFLLRNFLNNIIFKKEQSKMMKSQLLRVSNQVEEVTNFLNKELLKIKKVHDKIYPPRLTDFKGLKLASKFEAGISSGGEFFDTIKVQNKLLIMMSSCDSYLKSTSILSLFSALKERSSFDDNLLRNLVKEVESQFLQLSDSQSSYKANGLLLMVIDTKKLHMWGYTFGQFQIIRSEVEQSILENNSPISFSYLDKVYFESSLIRGEKMYITSPGLKSNWDRFKKDISLKMFVSDHIFIPGNELINEIFYQVKKEVGDDFLERDSSALLLEVSKNAISQV